MVEASFTKPSAFLNEQRLPSQAKPTPGHSIIHNESYHLPEIHITMVVIDTLRGKELKREQISIRAMEAQDDGPTISDSLQLCAIDFMYNPDVVLEHGKNNRSLVIEFEGVRADDVKTKWRCYVNGELVEPRIELENTPLKEGDVVEWRLEAVQ